MVGNNVNSKKLPYVKLSVDEATKHDLNAEEEENQPTTESETEQTNTKSEDSKSKTMNVDYLKDVSLVTISGLAYVKILEKQEQGLDRVAFVENYNPVNYADVPKIFFHIAIFLMISCLAIFFGVLVMHIRHRCMRRRDRQRRVQMLQVKKSELSKVLDVIPTAIYEGPTSDSNFNSTLATPKCIKQNASDANVKADAKVNAKFNATAYESTGFKNVDLSGANVINLDMDGSDSDTDGADSDGNVTIDISDALETEKNKKQKNGNVGDTNDSNNFLKIPNISTNRSSGSIASSGTIGTIPSSNENTKALTNKSPDGGNISLLSDGPKGNGEACVICFEKFEIGVDMQRVLPCGHGHNFHKDCLDPWILHHNTCPMCQRNIMHMVKHGVQGADAIAVANAAQEEETNNRRRQEHMYEEMERQQRQQQQRNKQAHHPPLYSIHFGSKRNK